MALTTSASLTTNCCWMLLLNCHLTSQKHASFTIANMNRFGTTHVPTDCSFLNLLKKLNLFCSQQTPIVRISSLVYNVTNSVTDNIFQLIVDFWHMLLVNDDDDVFFSLFFCTTLLCFALKIFLYFFIIFYLCVCVWVCA